jgi:hypothetical protein
MVYSGFPLSRILWVAVGNAELPGTVAGSIMNTVSSSVGKGEIVVKSQVFEVPLLLNVNAGVGTLAS